VSRPGRLRLVVVPLVLFLAVSGLAYGLSKAHPAKPGVPSAASSGAPVELGDPYRGQTIFEQTCASCHGAGGKGGAGPRLQDDRITLAFAKARIESGRGIMPAGLVKGQQEKDVLAYLQTLIAEPTGSGDAAAGARLFADRCASCHGQAGAGGGVGPKLSGAGLPEPFVRTRIAQGQGVMPAGLVKGAEAENVVAYLRSIGAVG
jgi:cytochrome c oxidase cbb3-type subunit 3